MRGKRILLFVFCIVPFLLAMPLQAVASTVNSGNEMPEEPVWEEPADHGSIDRFGTTSPWLSGTQDESIYGNTIVSPEELQDISAKEPGMVEKGISELVRNTGSALISLLQDSIGASLDRVVYGRVGSGRPNMVNVYAFELRKGNPYGVAASVCYALLRGMMFIFLGISFVFQLAKAAWSGQTARSRDEIKSMLPDMAAKFIAMAPGEISGQPYDLKYKSQKLADLYYVKVVAIEEDVSKVWVSCNAARRDMRPQIEEEINCCLKAGKEKSPIRVKGKVLRVQNRTVNGENMDTGVWLDLCGVGLLGYVYIGDWAQTYTPALKGIVSYGDVVEVQVIERRVRKQKKGDVVYYACSRKELVENPWEQKSLSEKYHEGDIVRIKCLSLKEGHWFGEINGLKDIQIFAEYPSAARDFPIIPGMEYMGKIYHMNTRERSLKVRVFQALTLEGFADGEAGKEEEHAGD